MPELPEVETVRRGLTPALEGRVIARAEIRRPDLRWPFPERMAERLTGARIDALGRRSKYLLLHLNRGETLIVHLGMSGRMVVEDAPVGVFHHETGRLAQHDHVIFHMDHGGRVVFNDPRRFGAMDLVATDRLEDHRLLAKLGPEPLGNTFDEDHLVRAFRGKATPVKAALLDQRIVAGLGNIYVCEALHRAGIAPTRRAGRIAAARVRRLVPVIRRVLDDAIAAGGSSLRDYRQADGALGYFQHTFRVYDREGCPCVTDGCDGTVRRIVQSGRSTFHCPVCQR
ncbi:DNA-(apurinic or apyrimidinic site) lyase [Palleronia salina]|uniref:Formamidopyrimidine-DNA glycosylase n=1 Tax=Palleronia salina TaxID=313368 RepID=A0A1M6EDH3_9RHOB|nr:bifunctional DNA-formamidopyrimidine glycosylase/DNA-(apurinic or apyrimidinic site) lyase [Palleronia salina]SHI83547.1 DNA-(apurinic or apyrimidinic site) lyase [Palleronia salina]